MHPWRRDEGSGSILVVALIGAVVAMSLMLLPLFMAFATRHSVAGAADAAALAAADTAIGIVAGEPCAAAGTVAASYGATVLTCELDGLVATITAARTVLGVAVTATATAGPPDSTGNGVGAVD